MGRVPLVTHASPVLPRRSRAALSDIIWEHLGLREPFVHHGTYNAPASPKAPG